MLLYKPNTPIHTYVTQKEISIRSGLLFLSCGFWTCCLITTNTNYRYLITSKDNFCFLHPNGVCIKLSCVFFGVCDVNNTTKHSYNFPHFFRLKLTFLIAVNLLSCSQGKMPFKHYNFCFAVVTEWKINYNYNFILEKYIIYKYFLSAPHHHPTFLYNVYFLLNKFYAFL